MVGVAAATEACRTAASTPSTCRLQCKAGTLEELEGNEVISASRKAIQATIACCLSCILITTQHPRFSPSPLSSTTPCSPPVSPTQDHVHPVGPEHPRRLHRHPQRPAPHLNALHSTPIIPRCFCWLLFCRGGCTAAAAAAREPRLLVGVTRFVAAEAPMEAQQSIDLGQKVTPAHNQLDRRHPELQSQSRQEYQQKAAQLGTSLGQMQSP